MAKKNSKLLLNKTSTRTKSKKKEDKYSEVSPTPKKSKSDFKYKAEDIIIYIGNVIPENHGKECKIIKLRNKHNQEYYLVEFGENETLECHCDFLLTQEEYELKQLDDCEDVRCVEIDPELLDKSLNNPVCCHNQEFFYRMDCSNCDKEPICVYKNKHNYKKLNIW